MPVLSNLFYRFNAVSAKTTGNYVVETDKMVSELTNWRGKRPRITNTILKKNKVKGSTLPNFKTYCKATLIKTV